MKRTLRDSNFIYRMTYSTNNYIFYTKPQNNHTNIAMIIVKGYDGNR